MHLIIQVPILFLKQPR